MGKWSKYKRERAKKQRGSYIHVHPSPSGRFMKPMPDMQHIMDRLPVPERRIIDFDFAGLELRALSSDISAEEVEQLAKNLNMAGVYGAGAKEIIMKSTDKNVRGGP